MFKNEKIRMSSAMKMKMIWMFEMEIEMVVSSWKE